MPWFPISLVEAVEDDEDQALLARQVMHRLLFALDLSCRLPKVYRNDWSLTGDHSHDAKEILVYAWRSGAALYWAHHFGPRYCGREH